MIISYGNVTKYKKSKKPIVKMTVKQYNLYTEFDKELMTERVDVVLVDHETREEKVKRYGKAVNWDNFDKGMSYLDKGLDGLNKMFKEFDKEWSKSLGSNNKQSSKVSIFPNKSKPVQRKTSGKRKQSRSNEDMIFGSSKTKVSVY